jgi:hypothetical protein
VATSKEPKDLVVHWQALLPKRKNLTPLLEFLAKLSEAERRSLASLAIKTYKTTQREAMRAFMASIDDENSSYHAPIGEALSAIATASLAELKTMTRQVWLSAMHDGKVGPETVLAARRPPWLSEWAEWMLEADVAYWRHVQPLVEQKLIAMPMHPHYALAFLGHHTLWEYSDGKQDSIEKFLRKRPEILKTIPYRLFEIPGSGEFSLANHDKYSEKKLHWSTALRNLAKDGLLDRGKLLFLSLEALNRDLPQYQAGWFSRFYEEYEPTPQEVASHVPLLVPLLGSKIPPTVAFAVNTLKKLVKGQGVKEPGKLITALAAGLRSTAKSTVSGALELYTLLMAKDPKRQTDVCIQIAQALGHEKVDVQKLLLKFLQKYGDVKQAKLRAAVQEQLPTLSASIRKEATKWLGEAPAEEVAGTQAPSAAEWKHLKLAVQKVKEPWRSLCGLTSLGDTHRHAGRTHRAHRSLARDTHRWHRDGVHPRWHLATVRPAAERVRRVDRATAIAGEEVATAHRALVQPAIDKPTHESYRGGVLLAD